jgi:hypothetical protein
MPLKIFQQLIVVKPQRPCAVASVVSFLLEEAEEVRFGVIERQKQCDGGNRCPRPWI